ncbi:hypothetical protein Adi01nite_06550 [Amorphoplanes digitatis]|uniref:Lipoprotein n=1 Tax=Actinoplanes digitatis TaxID=1868 RepID=A0A7W7I1L2_9ACTN|nr:hypothetical protein [Actinoplanes digitatis]MBB4764804.1 hypothetical protein [Actinoplanes digitatis]GID91243.1 hypothetical protein Adi01nite_06550 [Actinoplanes digitatis]
MTRPFLLTLSATVLLAVTGCGGTDSADGATPANGNPPAAAAGSYSAKDVCAYLKGEIPALREVGSPVGRHANLAGKLATFFESHGKPENGAVLDAATKAECPVVRTEVLTLIDVDSFSAF